MDDADRLQLNAAIESHCDWLEQRGVRFWDPRHEGLSLPPELLSAQALMELLATHATKPLVGAVVSSLHVLCSLRTRVSLSETRAGIVRDATQRLEKADDLSEQEKARQLAIISFAHDECHIKGLDPSLRLAQKNLGTARRRLQEYAQQLQTRHAKASAMIGAATSTADVALARWIFSRTEALEADFAFFRRHAEGQQWASHKGALGPKAWHHALNAGLATLKAGGLKSKDRLALFPGGFPKTDDRDEKTKQRSREYKARKRAEKRNKSIG